MEIITFGGREIAVNNEIRISLVLQGADGIGVL
jgi:hypothetical protein